MPENQKLVNDLGWTLFKASRFAEAKETLERAVAMNPSDGLAVENLLLCTKEIGRKRNGKARNSQAARRGARTLR